MRVTLSTLASQAELAGSGREGRDQVAWRVVVVVADPQIRSLLCALLAVEPDFVVAGEAADWLGGIDLVALHQPDLLLLDCHMPGLDGLAALPDIYRTAPETVVVAMSAAGSNGVEALALAAGADRFYPITPRLGPHLTDDLRDLMTARDSKARPRSDQALP